MEGPVDRATPRDRPEGGAGAVGEGKEDMIERLDDLAGVDDFVAELALGRRARQRGSTGAPSSLCARRFTHPRWPTQVNESGYLVIETCACVLPINHDGGCVCRHNIERHVYRVDDDGREHYATRLLAMAASPGPRT
jgi:hypothetical protein